MNVPERSAPSHIDIIQCQQSFHLEKRRREGHGKYSSVGKKIWCSGSWPHP